MTVTEITERGLVPVNGQRVKAYRKRRNWTQEKLAAESGISRSYISDIEMGRKYPRPVFATQLAETLGCQVKDLIMKSVQ